MDDRCLISNNVYIDTMQILPYVSRQILSKRDWDALSSTSTLVDVWLGLDPCVATRQVAASDLRNVSYLSMDCTSLLARRLRNIVALWLNELLLHFRRASTAVERTFFTQLLCSRIFCFWPLSSAFKYFFVSFASSPSPSRFSQPGPV